MISGHSLADLTEPRQRRRGLRARAVLSTVAAVAVALLTFATPASTQAVTRQATDLTLQVPSALDLGVHPQVTVRLTAGGASVPGELVSVKIGDLVSKQVTTGPTGAATVMITRDLSAGTYHFSAVFAGSSIYRSSSSATVTLIVRPAVLAVSTVPAMPNMALLIAGQGAVVKTGTDGIALINVSTVGPLALHLALPADTSSERVRLDRWDDGSTGTVLTIRIPDIRQVTIALQLLRPIQFTFKTPNGVPIAGSGVPFVDISDDAGKVTRLSGPAPYWIQANTITRLVTGFSSAVPEYRIVSVQVDGSEVVNRGQQRFTAEVAKTIPVELLVFDLAIQGRDALLKSAAGSKATVTSTTGIKYFVNLDAAGRASVRLPRAEYRILLGNGIGLPLSTPVALSRDQGVDVLFITPIDIGLVLGTGLLVAFALVVIGRPQVLRGRTRAIRLAGANPTSREKVHPPGRSGHGSGREVTAAPATPAAPALFWADPTARLAAPEPVQRPRMDPRALVAAAEVDVRPEVPDGPQTAAVPGAQDDHVVTRRRRTSRPPTTPRPAATKKSAPGQRPGRTTSPATPKRGPATGGAIDMPAATSEAAVNPKTAVIPKAVKPTSAAVPTAATLKPSATRKAVTGEAAATPSPAPPREAATGKPATLNRAATPQPSATRKAVIAKAASLKPVAGLEPSAPPKAPARKLSLTKQPVIAPPSAAPKAAPSKPAMPRGPATKKSAAASKSAASLKPAPNLKPGAAKPPPRRPAARSGASAKPAAALGPVARPAASPKPSASIKPGTSRSPVPIAGRQVARKSGKHSTPKPGEPARLNAASMPNPQKPAKSGKPGKSAATAKSKKAGKRPGGLGTDRV